MGYASRMCRYGRRRYHAANEPELRWWVWPTLAVIAAPPTCGISLLALAAYPLLQALVSATEVSEKDVAAAFKRDAAAALARSASEVARINAEQNRG